MPASPLTEEERSRYAQINKENVNFLHRRYNRVGRWVVADILRRSAYRYPKKPALIYQDKVFTYEELESKTNQVANALLALGLQKYDRVAILAHNTPHHVLTWLGTIKAGGIYLAINYLLRGKDIAYCLNHSESKIFIVEDALYPLVEEVKKDLSSVKTFIWSSQGKGEEAPAGWLSFDSWYASAGSAVPDVELDIHDPVQMVYTSGTEALPKAVVLTNQSLLSQYVGCIIDGEYTSADVCVNALPIFHCAQRDVFLNPCFLVGATNILLFQADPKAMLEAVQQHRATMLFCPPTVWIGLLRYPGSENYDLSSLGKCYYGASIMPVEVLKELLERIPKARFYNYYGQTELAPYHTILKPEDHQTRLGSAGKGGLNMETRLESSAHEPLGPGVPGEICGRGPHVMLMYFKDPEKTEEAFSCGWFHSGDVGVSDEDGYITVVDRKKDMVKTGGENVSSREVEEVIYQDPRVAEVAVVGLPHEKWVEGVTAFVVPKPGAKIGEEEIIALCREHLAGFKVPKGVVFVAELPKTPTGKILKRDLRASYRHFYAGR